MAASCAACLLPIRKGERFVLSGTEVFHGRCVTGIAHSKRTELELRLVELEREIAMARNDLVAARREATTERERGRIIASDRRQAEGDLRVARAARDAALRDAEYWKNRAANLETERDQARRELLNRQHPPAAAPVISPPEPAKDDRDASEIRFSLLEIDKT